MKSVILSFILITVTFFSLTPVKTQAADEPGFTYTIINGEATIIGYKGEPVYIEIPETLEGCPVTEIRDNAFFNCSSLRQISLPATITKMGHHCFYACYSLESIILPPALEEIGMGCFCGCSSLSTVSIPDTLSVLPDSCFRACTALKEIIVPYNVRKIEKFCFSGCTSLNYVSLGNQLTEIGNRAFFMCNDLESLYIPPSVEVMGIEAVGFIPTIDGSEVKTDFTVFGKDSSEAQHYADNNSLKFSAADEAVQTFSVQNPDASVPHIPKLLLTGGILLLVICCAFGAKQLFSGKINK